MTIRKGLPAKLALTDANDIRYDFRNLVTCNADGSPCGGLTSPVGPNVVTSTATMNVAVAAFNAVAVRDNGVVFLANDGTQNVLLDAAPVANSRIDVIYAKQNDSSSTVTTPDGNDTPVLTFAKGTAAASPTKPAVPTGAVELATVLIPAGATATNSSSPAVVITQTAQFTAAPGAPVPARSFSEMSGWTTAGLGQLANVYADPLAGLNGLYRFTGAVWVPVQIALAREIDLIGNVGPVSNGTTIVSSTIPALPFAYRINYRSLGTIGFSGVTGQFRVDVAATAGTISQPTRQNVQVVNAQWGPIAEGGYIDVPANSATTVTFRFTGTQTGYANIHTHLQIELPGSY